MKYLPLLILFSITNRFAIAQTDNFQELSISQLFIWNSTTIYDTYNGARAKDKSGKAWSNGTNLNYSFGLSKKLFANIGFGYFNQRFGIHRGFDFYEPNVVTGLFYTTKTYSYKSFNYFGGVGYRIKVKSKNENILSVNSEIRFSAIANFFYTFQQEFQHDFGENFLENPNPQIRKRSYQYGTSVHLKGGISRPIYRKIKIGVELTVPVYNRLRKDEIFRENTSEYHGINFAIGTSINLIYSLNN
ncbi:MAG: hypothetical protein LC096_03275 [Bacteroidia bacterium]|nr:hypothetical protein [Bacteroidia bacterium]